MNYRNGTPSLDAAPVFLTYDASAGEKTIQIPDLPVEGAEQPVRVNNLTAWTPNDQLTSRVVPVEKRNPIRAQVPYASVVLKYHDRSGQRLVKPVHKGRSIFKKTARRKP